MSAYILLNLIEKGNSQQEHNLNCLIAMNPNGNEAVLENLAKYCSPVTGFYILFHRNCTLKATKRLFGRLRKNNKPISYCGLDRLAKFFSSHTKASILESHANSLFWLDRYAIAVNPNTPRKIKKLLSKDSNILVRNATSSPLNIP